MATPTELARLAAAVNILRRDWPTASIQTLLTRDHAHRPFHDLAVAAVWIATDPASQTPKRLNEAGPWWATSRTSIDRVVIDPCPIHGDGITRRTDGTCGPCHADTHEAPPADPQPRTPPPAPLRQLVRSQHQADQPAERSRRQSNQEATP